MAVPKNRKTTVMKSLRALGCDEDRLRILGQEIDQLLWLEQKMDQARELIASEAIVVEYDNGGGQRGTRKNPAFEAMHRMTSSYNGCLKAIIDAVAPSAPAPSQSQSSEQSVIAKKDLMAALRRAEAERGTEHGGE